MGHRVERVWVMLRDTKETIDHWATNVVVTVNGDLKIVHKGPIKTSVIFYSRGSWIRVHGEIDNSKLSNH